MRLKVKKKPSWEIFKIWSDFGVTKFEFNVTLEAKLWPLFEWIACVNWNRINIFFTHMNYSVIKRIALLLNFNHVMSLGSNLLTRKVFVTHLYCFNFVCHNCVVFDVSAWIAFICFLKNKN